MENTQNNYRILLVDDEQNVLNALRRELTAPPLGRNHYEIEAFTSPVEALERAKTQSFDLVISDYQMPEMNGLAFLKEFARLHPDAARIVISGNADLDAIRAAVNDSHVYRFITKPWHDYYLKGSVSQALYWRHHTLENRRLADALRARGTELPPPNQDELCKVMVVDDDVAVLNALHRELTHHSNLDYIFSAMRYEKTGVPDTTGGLHYKFDVDTYSSPYKALQAAREIPYQCVIADYRMPEMDGVEFLQALEAVQPQCAKIMMSGMSDMNVVLGAINAAHVFSFFNKPWNEYELKSSISQAVAQRQLLLENQLLATLLKSQTAG